MDNIIKKIELEIDGVGIVLTPAQAKKLHAALGELMGVKSVVVKEREYVPYPVREPAYPRRPWITWGSSEPFIKCGDVGVTYTAHNGTAKLSV